MFGPTKSSYPVPHHNDRPEATILAHGAAIGLGVPLLFALIGSMIGGFNMAVIGFGLGLAACVVTVLVLTLLSPG